MERKGERRRGNRARESDGENHTNGERERDKEMEEEKQRAGKVKMGQRFTGKRLYSEKSLQFRMQEFIKAWTLQSIEIEGHEGWRRQKGQTNCTEQRAVGAALVAD